MKKYILLSLFIFSIFQFCHAQILSNIKIIRISNANGMPPDLRAKLSFDDYNGNNILEALETATITMIISNVGKGVAENLYITINDDITDNNLIINDKILISKLYPYQTDTFQIQISSKLGIQTNTHNLTISVSEKNGFEMQPVLLTMPTIEYQKPNLKLIGLTIIETGDDVYIKNYDGKVEKGERVKVKLSIQNIGNNLAQNTTIDISTTNDDILLFNNSSDIGDIKIGEVKEYEFILMPNNKVSVTGNLPLFFTAEVKYGQGSISQTQLPIAFDQKPPEPEYVTINPDYSTFNNQAAFVFSNNQKYSINDDLSIDTEVPKNPVKRNSYALIIGNANYSGNGSDVSDLHYTLNDARIFKKYVVNVLGVPDDNQHVYYVENANYTSFIRNLSGFGTLIKNSDANDVFYVYYSGHGAQNQDSVPYILPVDATMLMLDRLAVKMDDFYEFLIPPANKGKVIVFLDACFSGEKMSTNAKVGLRRPPKTSNLQSNIIVFAASSGKEISQEYGSKSHGLYTYFLLKILQDTKGNITYGELADRIIEEVHLTSLNPQNGFVEQKPEVNSSTSLGTQWRTWNIY
ncbi:MAG: caspase family protein [Bacteroidales bacterium]|nr:caspase family protein [Bacteroidales bacterium]